MPGKGTRCRLKWGLDEPQSRSGGLEKEKKIFLKIILLSISNENSVGSCRLYPHKFLGQFCVYSEIYGFNFSNKDLTNVVKFISVYPITSLGIGSS
jgi:hypothetical protein